MATAKKAAPKATTKANDIEDILGEGTPATTKAKADKAAPAKKASKPKAEEAAAPAKKASKPKAAAPAEKAKRVREPVEFAEGERDALLKRIPKLLKNPIASKDLAVKLDIPTRKLRPLLYTLQRAGTVVLELGASRTAGMTVSMAA